MRTDRFRGAAIRELRTLYDLGTIRGRGDAELLRQFLERDGEAAELAFSALVERHSPMVLRTCRAILGDSHASEDAAQAAFLVLLRQSGSLRVGETLGPWLHQVARRVARASRVVEARRRRHEALKSGSVPIRTVDRDRLIADESAEAVHEEVDRLPASYRTAVVLCDLQGLTHDEAARTLDWPIGTLKSRLTRGRERLRGRLLRRGFGPSVVLSAAAVAPIHEAAATARIVTHFAAGTSPAGAISLAKGVIRKMFLARIVATFLTIAGGSAAIGMATVYDLQATGDREANAPATLISTVRDDVRQTNPPAVIAEAAPEPPRPSEAARPSSSHPKPRPWETIVRVESSNEAGELPDNRSSVGVVVQSNDEESLIAVPSLALVPRSIAKADSPVFSKAIRVIPFEATANDSAKDSIPSVEFRPRESLEGQAIAVDPKSDIALVRIRPGRQLAASPLMPADYELAAGRRLLTIQFQSDGLPRLFDTVVSQPRHVLGLFNGTRSVIQCQGPPGQGGILFAAGNDLAGICTYTDPEGEHALYAPARAIRELLEQADRLVSSETPPKPANRLASVVASIDVPRQDDPSRHFLVSGIVIQSYDRSAYIATASHPLRFPDFNKPGTSHQQVAVRLFPDPGDGPLPNAKEGSYIGEVVANDEGIDLALVRIVTGHRIPAANLAATVMPGGDIEALLKVDCPDGVTPRVGNADVVLAGNPHQYPAGPDDWIKRLAERSKTGLPGAGLFDRNHVLIGIRSFNTGDNRAYIPARQIRQLLESIDLAAPSQRSSKPKEAPKSDLERRMDAMEGKLDRVLKALETTGEKTPKSNRGMLGP